MITDNVSAAEQIIYQFTEGASISAAENLWKTIKDKESVEKVFIAAALAPKKVMVANKLSEVLKNHGAKLGSDDYNHSVARIIGNMLLEANDYPFSAKLTEKLGGKSTFTATKLTGKAKEIQDANKNRFSEDEINKYKSSFVMTAARKVSAAEKGKKTEMVGASEDESEVATAIGAAARAVKKH
jgi:hypothetical protein